MPAVRARSVPVPVPVARVPARYSPALLVRVAQWVRSNETGRVEVAGYGGRSLTAGEWKNWFRACLMQKINAADPKHCDNQKTKTGRIWRKTTDEYQRELWRLGNHLRNRIMIRGVGSVAWHLLGARVKVALADRVDG